ncbi:MAG TPA: hypothetical protein VFZ59_12540 [Verrucomicrobiae bacterium]|nr:hypothetical protein [Verrucomicrobiae bacterium]
MQTTVLEGVEINPKMVGAIFTEVVGESLRVFCLYVNGDRFECVVPAEENQQNIATIFAQLDMPENCASLIAERVVQGRLYSQDHKGAWMYTLLATDGSHSPGLSSRMDRLPWKTVWRTQTTEVLLLKDFWSRNYCYAVRAELTGEDLKNSLAKYRPLVHPLLPPTKRTLPLVTLAILFLAVGLLAGGAAWFRSRGEAPLPVRASAAEKPLSGTEVAPATKYCLLLDREIQGPFEMPAILKMRASGMVTSDTLIRLDGALDWHRFDDFVDPKASTEKER